MALITRQCESGSDGCWPSLRPFAELIPGEGGTSRAKRLGKKREKTNRLKKYMQASFDGCLEAQNEIHSNVKFKLTYLILWAHTQLCTHAHTRVLSGWLKWIATIDFQVISTFQVDAHLANGCVPLHRFQPLLSGKQYWESLGLVPAFWQHLSGSALNFTEMAVNENAKKQIVSITEYCRFAFPPTAVRVASSYVPNGFTRRIRDFRSTKSPSDSCNWLCRLAYCHMIGMKYLCIYDWKSTDQTPSW